VVSKTWLLGNLKPTVERMLFEVNSLVTELIQLEDAWLKEYRNSESFLTQFPKLEIDREKPFMEKLRVKSADAIYAKTLYQKMQSAKEDLLQRETELTTANDFRFKLSRYVNSYFAQTTDGSADIGGVEIERLSEERIAVGLYVAPAFRGRGIGRALLDWVINTAREDASTVSFNNDIDTEFLSFVTQCLKDKSNIRLEVCLEKESRWNIPDTNEIRDLLVSGEKVYLRLVIADRASNVTEKTFGLISLPSFMAFASSSAVWVVAIVFIAAFGYGTMLILRGRKTGNLGEKVVGRLLYVLVLVGLGALVMRANESKVLEVPAKTAAPAVPEPKAVATSSSPEAPQAEPIASVESKKEIAPQAVANGSNLPRSPPAGFSALRYPQTATQAEIINLTSRVVMGEDWKGIARAKTLEEKIRRLVRYYKSIDVLPGDWKYNLASIKLILE